MMERFCEELVNTKTSFSRKLRYKGLNYATAMTESLLKVNNKDIKTKSVGIGLVSLLLTLNKLKPIDASITLSEALEKKSQFFFFFDIAFITI